MGLDIGIVSILIPFSVVLMDLNIEVDLHVKCNICYMVPKSVKFEHRLL